jgi:hypothetical protein
MKKIVIALLIIFLIPVVKGQVTVTVGSLLLQDPGTDIHVPVLVKGLNANTGGIPVTGIELHIKYSNSYLEYDTTINFSNLTPSAQWYYGVNAIEYAANWVEPGLSKLNIPDNTKLFDIVFHYLGGTTELIFDSLHCLLLDSTFAMIPSVHYVNGVITPSAGTGESRWNGTGAWNTMANWSNGIPGDSTDAVIETGVVTTLSNAVCKSLKIQLGTTLRVASGFSLTVNKNFVNDGLFYLQSDATGDGSLIVNGSVSGAGTNHLERYLPFESSFPHLVSSPVAGASAILFGGMNLQTYSEPNGAWESVGTGSQLATGQGYRVSGSSSNTVDFQGVFHTTAQVISNLSYTASSSPETRGLALVGNPFPSAVQWEQGSWNRNNLDYAVYIWDGYKFLSWNGITGSLKDGIIPAMQGFFVKANGPVAALTIPADARMHSAIPFYKEVESVQDLLRIRLESTQGIGYFDETFIHIRPGSTNNFDGNYDAWKIFGSDQFPQLFSLGSDQSSLSINSIPLPASVTLGVRTIGSGSYKLSFNEILTFNPNQPLFFEDKQTNTVVNLRNNNEYVFSTDQVTETGRFVLHFAEVGLPEPSKGGMTVRIADGRIFVTSVMGAIPIEEIVLTNVNGQIIQRINPVSAPCDFRIKQELNGLCIIRIITSQGIFARKLLLNQNP